VHALSLLTGQPELKHSTVYTLLFSRFQSSQQKLPCDSIIRRFTCSYHVWWKCVKGNVQGTSYRRRRFRI